MIIRHRDFRAHNVHRTNDVIISMFVVTTAGIIICFPNSRESFDYRRPPCRNPKTAIILHAGGPVFWVWQVGNARQRASLPHHLSSLNSLPPAIIYFISVRDGKWLNRFQRQLKTHFFPSRLVEHFYGNAKRFKSA